MDITKDQIEQNHERAFEKLIGGEMKVTADSILQRGADHIKDRASQRDNEGGERSMKRAVDAFNAAEGESLTEAQGWRFMVMLKYARATAGNFNIDDYEDMAAYAALAAECEAAK